jgi:hypothetical protein
VSQPVKLSDSLVLDARLAGEAQQRSIAGQVEFWARLGKSVELLLNGQQVQRLCSVGAARPISECLRSVDSPEGRARFKEYMAAQPFPHYAAHPTRKGLLVRIEANGRRTVGRFVNREFVPERSRKKH